MIRAVIFDFLENIGRKPADGAVELEEAGQEKPSGTAFDRLRSKLPFEPDEMLMIGDSQKKDISGAWNAGMHGLLFLPEQAADMDRLVMEYINGCVDKKI